MGAHLCKTRFKSKPPEKPDQKSLRKRALGVQFVGLLQGGKTTLWHQFKFGNLDSLNANGFHSDFEIVTVNSERIALWDVQTRERTRPILMASYARKDGLVVVMDSSDVKGTDDALVHLNDFVLTNEISENKILMVVANKQDLDGAFPVEKIEGRVRKMVSALGPTFGGRSVFVKGCSAKTGEGVQEAFSSLLELIRLQKEGELTPGFHSLPLLQDDKNDNTNKDGKVDGKDENEKQLDYLLKMYDTAPSVKSILFY